MKKNLKIFFKFFLIAVILLFVDIYSKYLTHNNIFKMGWSNSIFPYGGIGIFKDFYGISFSLNYVENLGAAWGVFSTYSKILLYLRIVIVLCLFFYLIFINKEKEKKIPLMLVIVGATGNIVDIFFYGHVIDMLHFNFWGKSFPVFNFADCLITFGIFLLILQSIFSKKENQKKQISSNHNQASNNVFQSNLE